MASRETAATSRNNDIGSSVISTPEIETCAIIDVVRSIERTISKLVESHVRFTSDVFSGVNQRNHILLWHKLDRIRSDRVPQVVHTFVRRGDNMAKKPIVGSCHNPSEFLLTNSTTKLFQSSENWDL